MKKTMIVAVAVAAAACGIVCADDGADKAKEPEKLVESSLWFGRMPQWAEEIVNHYYRERRWNTMPTSSEEVKRYMDEKWKDCITRSFNVGWPEGSSVEYIHACRRLEFKTTAENAEKIRKLNDEAIELDKKQHAIECVDSLDENRRFDEARGGVRHIEISATMFSVPDETYVELGLEKTAAKIDADALFDVVAKRPETKRLGSIRVVTNSGEEIVGKSVSEYIYPTDYDVQVPYQEPKSSSLESFPTALTAVVEPQAFSMREIGMILDVTPVQMDYDKTLIDFELNWQFVGKPAWKDYGVDSLPVSARKDGAVYALPMEQPFFPLCSINAKMTVRSGKAVLFCNPEPSSDKSPSGRMVLSFVTATAINI